MMHRWRSTGSLQSFLTKCKASNTTYKPQCMTFCVEHLEYDIKYEARFRISTREKKSPNLKQQEVAQSCKAGLNENNNFVMQATSVAAWLSFAALDAIGEVVKEYTEHKVQKDIGEIKQTDKKYNKRQHCIYLELKHIQKICEIHITMESYKFHECSFRKWSCSETHKFTGRSNYLKRKDSNLSGHSISLSVFTWLQMKLKKACSYSKRCEYSTCILKYKITKFSS